MTTVGRLRGRRTFTALAKQGRTVRSGPLRVRFLAAPPASLTGPSTGSTSGATAAVGYAISKAIGGAVDRNRIRRRIRGAILVSTTPLTSGFYLVSADASALRMSFADLTGAWDTIAGRLNGEAVAR